MDTFLLNSFIQHYSDWTLEFDLTKKPSNTKPKIKNLPDFSYDAVFISKIFEIKESCMFSSEKIKEKLKNKIKEKLNLNSFN